MARVDLKLVLVVVALIAAVAAQNATTTTPAPSTTPASNTATGVSNLLKIRMQYLELGLIGPFSVTLCLISVLIFIIIVDHIINYLYNM